MENREEQNKALLEIQALSAQPDTPTAQVMFDMKKGEPVAILVTSWIELETVTDKHGYLQKLITKEFGSRGMTAEITALQHIWGIWQVSENENLKFDFYRQENGDNPAAQKYTWCDISYKMITTPNDTCWECGEIIDDEDGDGGLCTDCESRFHG